MYINKNTTEITFSSSPQKKYKDITWIEKKKQRLKKNKINNLKHALDPLVCGIGRRSGNGGEGCVWGS